MDSIQIVVAVLMTIAAAMMFIAWRRDGKPLLAGTAAAFTIAAIVFWVVALIRA